LLSSGFGFSWPNTPKPKGILPGGIQINGARQNATTILSWCGRNSTPEISRRRYRKLVVSSPRHKSSAIKTAETSSRNWAKSYECPAPNSRQMAQRLRPLWSPGFCSRGGRAAAERVACIIPSRFSVEVFGGGRGCGVWRISEFFDEAFQRTRRRGGPGAWGADLRYDMAHYLRQEECPGRENEMEISSCRPVDTLPRFRRGCAGASRFTTCPPACGSDRASRGRHARFFQHRGRLCPPFAAARDKPSRKPCIPVPGEGRMEKTTQDQVKGFGCAVGRRHPVAARPDGRGRRGARCAVGRLYCFVRHVRWRTIFRGANAPIFSATYDQLRPGRRWASIPGFHPGRSPWLKVRWRRYSFWQVFRLRGVQGIAVEVHGRACMGRSHVKLVSKYRRRLNADQRRASCRSFSDIVMKTSSEENSFFPKRKDFLMNLYYLPALSSIRGLLDASNHPTIAAQ